MAEFISKNTPSDSSATSHPFTCVSCGIAFQTSQLQKDHKRTEWHRYNLLRRSESLNPVTLEFFNQRVSAAQAERDAKVAKLFYKKRCDSCDSVYKSHNAYESHLASRKHQLNAAAAQGKTPKQQIPPSRIAGRTDHQVSEATASLKDVRITPVMSNVNADEKHVIMPASSSMSNLPIDPNIICLFCNYRSPNQKLNVNHMSVQHSMFIPELEFIVDLDGLLAYLSIKVRDDNQCISCNSLKKSRTALQDHMRDSGHCKIAYETEEEQLEIGDFYDFRSTYSDEEASDGDEPQEQKLQAQQAKLGKQMNLSDTLSGPSNAFREGDDSDAGGSNGDGWETDSTDDSVASELIGRVYTDTSREDRFIKLAKNQHHSHFDARPHQSADGWHSHAHSHHAVFRTEYELHLPSGKSVGHRSLNRYFRQNLHNHPPPRMRSPPPPKRAIISNSDTEDDEDEDAETGDRSSNQLASLVRDRGRQLISQSIKNGMAGVKGKSQKRAQRAERNDAIRSSLAVSMRAQREYKVTTKNAL
ncbi:MAG: hypothetical protein M1814_005846 [Vezdaea aestivalis]|nr:MAG: hypothetical protein M1814_005846 [Vezdaea aestivalis]